MALILLSGYPCVGKSAFAEKLKSEIIKRDAKQKVAIVNEELLGLDKINGYIDSSNEKTCRANLKAAIDRALSTKNSIVIADSLNYIKGYRYELYCMARSLSLRTCCVLVVADDNISDSWHATRQAADENTYTDDV